MRTFILLVLAIAQYQVHGQKFATIKKQLESGTVNPIEYCNKNKLNYRIDTVQIKNTSYFESIVDSISYKGKVGKVYGSFENGKYMVQVLGKVNNYFTRMKRIGFDTANRKYSFALADSLSNAALQKIRTKERKFEEIARLYNTNYGFGTDGDMGYCAVGSLVPELETKIKKSKTGDVFKFWSNQGASLIKIVDKGKQDVGFVLLLVINLIDKKNS